MEVREQALSYDGIAEWYDQCVRAHTFLSGLHKTVADMQSDIAVERHHVKHASPPIPCYRGPQAPRTLPFEQEVSQQKIENGELIQHLA